jgi:hypothetical protein
VEPKTQRNARERKNYRKNPESWTRARYRYRYGIELEDRDALLAQQGGLCPLCELPIVGFGLAAGHGVVDHCHATKRVRGILHATCNKQLGGYEAVRERAEAYLKRAEANPVRCETKDCGPRDT